MFCPAERSPTTSVLSPSLIPLGKSLVIGKMHSIAEAIVNHDSLADTVFKFFVERISLECGSLCRKTQELSPFRKIQLAAFQWTSFKEHLSAKAPLLLSLFSTIISHSDHRNKEKAHSAHYPGICMATAILLKERNREMCGVQSLISTTHTQTNRYIYKLQIQCTCICKNTTGLCTVESYWSEFELYGNTEPHG